MFRKKQIPTESTADAEARQEQPAEKTLPLKTAQKKKKKWTTTRSTVPHRHWLARLLIIAAIVLAGILYIRSLSDTSSFETTFYILDEEKLEYPMRVVLLSDLHLQEFGEDNCELVERVRKLKPDLIAIAGDMMNQDNPDDSVVVTLCRQLVEIAPVYYAYGNHEGYVIRVEQTSDLDQRLKKLGVHMLHNEYETINVNGNIIDLGCLDAGIDYFYEPYVTRFWTRYQDAENYHLLIVHYPNYFMPGAPLEYGQDVDLALCGHLHGGMIVVPGLGGLYHPSTGFFPKFYSGVHMVEEAKIIISRGLGSHGFIPRINNPPELVVIDLE